MRKLVYGALALSAALVASFGVDVKDAEAAKTESNEKTWTVSSSGDLLTLQAKKGSTDVSKIMVGVPTFKKAKIDGVTQNDIAAATVSAWDFYTASDGEIKVDLSKYAGTKENYLLVKADSDLDEDAVLVKIPKSKTADVKKATYEADTGLLVVSNGAKKTPINYTEDNLSFYTDGGTEDDLVASAGKYSVPNIEQYKQTGATLYIQDKGNAVLDKTPSEQPGIADGTEAQADFVVVGKTNYKNVVVGPNNKEIKYVTVGARKSKAIKVGIKKTANAPKVTFDYLKGTITIKGKTSAPVQYTFGGDSWKEIVGINNKTGEPLKDDAYFTMAEDVSGSVTGTKVVTLGEAIVAANANFYVDVFSGTADAPTSKTARYTFEGQDTTDTEPLAAMFVYNYGTGKYELQVANSDTKNAYTVAITQPGANATAAPKVASAVLNAGTDGESYSKTISPKTALTKVEDVEKLAENDAVTVYKNGDKNALVWRGTTVNLPYTVESTGDESAAFDIMNNDSSNVKIVDTATVGGTTATATGSNTVKCGETVKLQSAEEPEVKTYVYVGANKKKAVLQWQEVELVDATEDGSDVKTWSFKMPAGNVIIGEVPEDGE